MPVYGIGRRLPEFSLRHVGVNLLGAKLLSEKITSDGQPLEPLESFRWSSYPAYLDTERRRPKWLSVRRLLGE
jgi:hypothetical protein